MAETSPCNSNHSVHTPIQRQSGPEPVPLSNPIVLLRVLFVSLTVKQSNHLPASIDLIPESRWPWSAKANCRCSSAEIAIYYHGERGTHRFQTSQTVGNERGTMEVEVLLGPFLEYSGNITSRCIDSVNREQGAASPDPSITLFEQLFHGLNNSRFNPQ